MGRTELLQEELPREKLTFPWSQPSFCHRVFKELLRPLTDLLSAWVWPKNSLNML